MDIYEKVEKLEKLTEKMEVMRKTMVSLHILAKTANNAETYNRCAALQLRLGEHVKTLTDEFERLKDEILKETED